MALAQRGADVVAVDLSPTLVGLAAERAAGRFDRGTITWHAGDMLDPALGHFDHVVAMDSLIHYQSWDMVNAYAALAARTRRSLLVTFAPWTPLLGTLHAVGGLFPRADRAPRIVPVKAGLLRVAATTDRRLAGWTLGRTRRVSRGFYTSQALELRRGQGTSSVREDAA
ncbi:MAG: methyltransferase domain-containing protein [Gemmatimonadaceae bacterium]|nr:methyltransferase domain-containing protein [Gemmatimonadaceae bacterium]